ncbi:MAG: TerB N-terminal domain-containing protein, partial [Myxococcota bacterium]
MGSGARPRWVPAREFVRIQGHAIAGGLFYLGRQGRGEFTDGCYIDPDLPARRRRLWESEGCPIYWAPRYDSMARQYRGAYLAWLAGGRCDPKVDIGYVLLFFHGLERRFFIDGQKGIVPLEEKVLIIREVKRLMRVYKQKYLLEDYGTDFLAAVWALHHQKPVIPKYIDPVRNVYTGLFRLILGEHVAAKKRLPPRMAYQWTVLATEKPYKIDKYFHHEKMQELFAIRYAQSFGEGLLVKPNKKRLELLYSPANPSLREERIRLHGP